MTYVSPLEKGFDEYKLPKKIHKKFFKYKKADMLGLKKYRYYEKDGVIVMETWTTPLILLWIMIMYVPGVLYAGIPEANDGAKMLFRAIYKEPLTSMDVCYKNHSDYEEFMANAKLIKKGLKQ